LSQAAADMAGAQAKGAGLKASGYGSATADLMAQKKMEEETANNEANRLAELEKAKLYSTARVDAAEARGTGKTAPVDNKVLDEVRTNESYGKLSDAGVAAIATDSEVNKIIKRGGDAQDVLIYLLQTYGQNVSFDEVISAKSSKSGKEYSALGGSVSVADDYPIR